MINGKEFSRPRPRPKFSYVSIIFSLLFFISFALTIVAQNTPPESSNDTTTAPASAPSSPTAIFALPNIKKYTPKDNVLIACGAQADVTLLDGRTFKSDPSTVSFLSTNEDVKVNVNSINTTTTSNNNNSNNNDTDIVVPSSPQLFSSCRIFPNEATYKFPISEQGFHFVRLYFYPLPHITYNLSTAVFGVSTEETVLLHDFTLPSLPNPVFKEYLINITSNTLTLKFTPKTNSLAFINAIEVVSVPDDLVPDTASSVPPGGSVIDGVSNYAFEVAHRVNVGGPLITPSNDTLWRTWLTDVGYNVFPKGTFNTRIAPKEVKYPDGGATEFIAPQWVYSTAAEMAVGNASTAEPNFNLTWKLPVEDNYNYLVRLHFCDIVSAAMNELYFNVYLNGMVGVNGLDLSILTSALGTAYYRDFVINSTTITNSSVMIQVGPASGGGSSQPNAILNGIEVIKMSNSAGSLSGLFDVNGNYMGETTGAKTMKILAVVGLVLGVVACVLVIGMFIRWQRRPQDWERCNSFSSWLLPLTSSHTFLSSKSHTGSRKSSVMFGSRKSSMVYSTNNGVGKFFRFNQLQEASNNFDENAVIGVGGFGKVYMGQLEDGTKVAIKRGNPQSEQGINEFQTEIQMLSQLRHRHLVSLIGYCDENAEMCLVYEFMSNGVLREHLYGSKLQLPLTWKQRLDICIGAARGLHYLHTGAAHCIIHRDVKTTNILLDEKFVAKVSDFGLSKAACLIEQTHVSTAVKGSFGYLDPEYFRRQQLTEKSDVYSFGVVLLEVLTARPALDTSLSRDQVNLAEWGMSNYRKGNLENIIDPNLKGAISPGSLKKYVEAAEKCLAEYGVDRPSMGDVLWHLEYALQLQDASNNVKPPEENSSLLIPFESAFMVESLGAHNGRGPSSNDHT
ncbi:putative receptor-like protein kinase At5g61350 [Silene latifolia]|uniref:putative receptor-like protein kinase At5g61350 n=1 Tax=Silene latifolia TaxID=37657 RepID=UPI003D76DE4D